MSWRPAKTITVFRDLINKQAPKRSKRSDGIVGDLAHQASKSDHNPNSKGVVTAIDITHDPVNGVDCEKLYKDLVTHNKSMPIKYIIWNKTITSKTTQPWVRRRYTGSNPHTKHLHLSVSGSYDSTKEWTLPSIGKQAPKPRPVVVTPKGNVPAFATWTMGAGYFSLKGNNGPSDGLKKWQRRMVDRGYDIEVDGKFGPQMDKTVRYFQGLVGLRVDGNLGQKTWEAAWTEPLR